MANYECVFMARPEVSAAQVETLTNEFTEIVTSREGEVVYSEYWGLKPTAYRIKKNRKAHYVLMHISANSDALDEMHRIMGLNEDILRSLTTRVDAFEETPTIMMRQKSRSDRDSRGPRGDRGDRPQREDRGYRSRPSGGDSSASGDNAGSTAE